MAGCRCLALVGSAIIRELTEVTWITAQSQEFA